MPEQSAGNRSVSVVAVTHNSRYVNPMTLQSLYLHTHKFGFHFLSPLENPLIRKIKNCLPKLNCNMPQSTPSCQYQATDPTTKESTNLLNSPMHDLTLSHPLFSFHTYVRNTKPPEPQFLLNAKSRNCNDNSKALIPMHKPTMQIIQKFRPLLCFQ